jgi:SAM-dependent methyltransferase
VTSKATDWAGWLRRWEAQQTRHMPDREIRFEVIIGAVRAHCGPAPRVIDLGCGPGSLSLRLTRAIPGARVVGVDQDPLLLLLGRHALGGKHRIALVDADLGDPELPRVGDTFDAAVSTTALHWLRLEPLRQLYRSLAVMLKPGGLFLDGDHQHGTGAPLLDNLVANTRGPEPPDGADGANGAETWEQWWQAAEEEPGFAAAIAERQARAYDHPHHDEGPTLLEHQAGLRDAGFREVGTIWQHLDDRVLAAIL